MSGTLIAFVFAVCSADVAIDPNKSVIVTSPALPQTAVEELRLHVKLISGVDVPLRPSAEQGAYAFRFDPTLPQADNAESCAWEVRPNETVFRGNALFAVLDFLENGLGVRWPEGEDIAVEPSKVLKPVRTSGRWCPQLKIRTLRASATGHENAVFRRRMRDGFHNEPAYRHAFTNYWAQYGSTRRDYFAMRPDGIRGPWNAKPEALLGNVAVYAADTKNTLAMCCTSTGLVERIVANWRADGCPDYINLCENDVPGQNSCQCPSCKALDVIPAKVDETWETHYADRYVYFGNQVLRAARAIRPDVKVCYYAYNATQDAPGRERPDEGTVLGIVPTYFTYDYIARYVQGWKRMGLKEFFYRPNRHYYYNCTYLPLGAEEHFFNLLQYLYKEGAIGFDYDTPGARKGGFEWFERYVLFHALQDPSQPFSHWEEHYAQAFGAAADDILSYYRYWRTEVWNKRLEPNLDEIVREGELFNFARGMLRNLAKYYHSEDFAAAERFLSAAEGRTLSAPQRERVARLRVAHEHAKVFYRAIVDKSRENSQALVDFRTANGYPVRNWLEAYFDDITGIEALYDVRHEPNYDESKVPPYELEDPLKFEDGTPVRDAADWNRRRQEILRIFAKKMYGREPQKPDALETELWDEKVTQAGFAIRRQYRMWFRKDRTGPCVNWIVWTPRHATGPVPVILFLNYRGNHELVTDADIPVQQGWVRNNPAYFITDHRASEKTRGLATRSDADSTFPLNTILARGYAVASACYCEVSPDPTAAEPPPYEQRRFAYTGVFSLWGYREEYFKDNPTALGAWAWALSRGLDLMEKVPGVDAKKAVVTGCSRLGKAALLAAARDERFAVCVPNQCGGGGVTLAKRDYGENPSTEVHDFSHWYCKAYRDYNDDYVHKLTFDQHLLVASIAPRAVLVEGFNTSKWMDPKGEFLACVAAAPVWRFLGRGTMPDVPYPAPYSTAAIGEAFGYVLRTEGHGIADCDWMWLLDFADGNLGK